MKKILLYLILLMALSMAGIVAYVSVTGLLKVFTGAGSLGLMLFTSIEIAKVVATSAIHTYGKKIGWFYNILLSIFIFISMVITSMGIYGFLSSSYKANFAEMESINSKVELLEEKKESYGEQLEIVKDEKISLNTTINDLTKGLSNNVIQYKDNETGEIITTTSSSTRRVLQKQLDNANKRIIGVNTKVDSLSNLVFELDNEILETKMSNEAAGELSTLQYLADITGQSMDDVMKWFILVLIIIGDPMAVLMVIVFNKVINYGNKGDKHNDNPDNRPDDDPDNDNYFNPIDSYTKPEFSTPIRASVKNVKMDTVNEKTGEINIPKEVELITFSEPEPSDSSYEEDVESKSSEIEEEENVESQIKKNKENISNITEKTGVKVSKLPPVISNGKIKREDIKEVKERSRGYSVEVPKPKEEISNDVKKVGTNKEVRSKKPNILFFNKPNK